MGVLNAVERAPFLALSLFAGVWIDRRSPRSTLIVADLGRAVFLASITAVALLGLLRIEYLYVVALLVGTLTVFFDVAYYAFLPVLIDREQLVDGNTKLTVSESVVSIAGPGFAGVLVQLLTAPIAIFVDACSFLVSVGSLLAIRLPKVEARRDAEGKSVWREIGDGLEVVFKSPFLRPLAVCGATHNCTSSMLLALFVLYMSRVLHFAPATIGLVFACGSAGALLGSLFGGRMARTFGVGHTIGGAQLLTACAYLLVPLAHGPPVEAIGLMAVSQVLWGASRPPYNIAQVSLRQAITPDRLLGRMTASMRFVTWGVMPVGALLGGGLGSTIGIRPTMFVIVAGEAVAALWIVFSPLWTLREVPAAAAPVE